MHHHNSKRKKLIKIIAVYLGMTISTIAIVTFIILIVLGFRFDINRQQIEQYAFLQFNSTPIGSMVAVDGRDISGRTPNKTSVPEGTHEVVVWRDGYETWRKTLYVKSGTLTWLSHILMIPNKLSVEPVEKYDAVYMSLASADGKYMAVQQYADKPSFDLVDLSVDTVKSVNLTIPKKDYSEAYNQSANHSFRINKWDHSERYLLIQHNYNDRVEWLVLDSQDENNSKNITKLFDLDFSNVEFSGNGGNIMFVLESGNIRKIDTGAGTISKPLVSKVKQFNLYDQNIVTYIGDDDSGARLVGLYRDGDETPFIIREIPASDIDSLSVASTHYFNQDYVAIIQGKKVDILNGSYRNSIINNTPNLALLKTFEIVENAKHIGFSPDGQYFLAQSGANFTSYDLEYDNLTSSTVDNSSAVSSLKWLNDSYFWSDNGGNLSIREFDGSNPRSINKVTLGQDIVITHSGRYIYSIDSAATSGYQLQRVRLILP